jgi:glycosyltransferase involved in cell wall biosynthesis
MTSRTITIAGSLAQRPGCGGHTWVFLQYLLGFKKLGWNVLFVDRLEPAMCVNQEGEPSSIETSWNLDYFLNVMRAFGLENDYALLCNGHRVCAGLTRQETLTKVRQSAALINVMGYLNDEELLAAAPTRVFLDIDPGFGQMWQALGLHDTFRGHDAFVTIGERLGKTDCSIPACDLSWIPTRPPVVLEQWPAADNSTAGEAPITSVATWRGPYGPVEYGGTTYGLRVHEFRKFVPLPGLTGRRFEVALDIHPGDAKDVALLTGHGWSLMDTADAAGDPWRYRQYIRRSAAEVMIAKGMYVQSRSGWFSDRSLCYLASGKPVLAQDTGLSDLFPTGEGLVTFATLDEAVEGTSAIMSDYDRHARAARRLAEEWFDSDKVLRRLTRELAL